MAKLTFTGGIHTYDGKELSKDKPIVDILPKGDLVYPLSQHIGAPAVPIVKKGDYVLTGGELPAMVMVDAISRMVPGVLSNEDSGVTESFYDNLLEYPQYSRPEVWHDKRVPEVLLSGHHKNIEKWRLEQSIKRTQERRPDLYEKYLANKQ